MKIYRFLLLGIILFIYACGGGGESTSPTARVSTPGVPVVPVGQLAIAPTFASVWGIFNGPPPAEPNVLDDVTFTIAALSGTPPFTVTSNAPSLIASPGIVPPAPCPCGPGPFLFTVDPNNVLATTIVQLTVVDSLGLTTIVQVEIRPLEITVFPNAVIGVAAAAEPNATDDMVLTVNGGFPPYVLNADNVLAFDTGLPTPITMSGDTFTLDPKALLTDTTVVLSLQDQNLITVQASVTIFSTAAGMTVTSDKVNVIGVNNSLEGAIPPAVGGDATDDITFTINGGNPPWMVTSSNNAVGPGFPQLVAGPSPGTFVVDPEDVTTTTPLTFTVIDSGSNFTMITVSIFETLPLTITADKLAVLGLANPEAVATDDITFTVYGGEPPYNTFSSNDIIMPGEPFVGTPFTIDPDAAVVPTVVTMTVTDNVATSATIDITVLPTAAGLSITPSQSNLIGIDNDAEGAVPPFPPVGTVVTDDVVFTILDGVPPYIVTFSNVTVMPGCPCGGLTPSGATQTVDPNSVASNTVVTATVTDFSGNTATTDVTVFPIPDLTITADVINVIGTANPDAVGADNVTLTVFGGTAPYVIEASDPVLAPGGPWTVATSGGVSVPVQPVDVEDVVTTTSVTFTVTDDAPGGGDTATVTINILPVSPQLNITADIMNVIGVANPDAVAADNISFTVTGGTPPYVFEADNPALLPGGPWSVATSGGVSVPAQPVDANNVGATTTVNVTVTDNIGDTATVAVKIFGTTVAPPPPGTSLTITPSVLNVIGVTNPDAVAADNIIFTVTGGTAPYMIESAIPALTPGGPWPIAVSGGITPAVDVQSVAVTTPVTLTVTDNVGDTAAVTIKIFTVFVPAGATLDITASVMNVIGVANPDAVAADNITFTVVGGTAPYMVESDTPGLTPGGPWAYAAAGAVSVPVQPVDVQSVGVTTPVILTVTDDDGNTDTVTVNIYPDGTVLPLDLTASVLNVIGVPNVDAVAADNITFTVVGGTAPYMVEAANPALLPGGPWAVATSGGTTAVVDANNVGITTPVVVTVTDNVGDTDTVTVNIFPLSPSPSLVITASALNAIGVSNPDAVAADNITFTVTGGTAPYIIESNLPALTPGGPWPIASSGGTTPAVDVNAVGATTPVILTVTDDLGATASITINIYSAAAGLTVASNKLNVIGFSHVVEGVPPAPGATSIVSDDITLTVTGGTSPFSVSAGADNALFTLTPSALLVPGPWPLVGAPPVSLVLEPDSVAAVTVVTITVTDSLGAIATQTLTIYP